MNVTPHHALYTLPSTFAPHHNSPFLIKAIRIPPGAIWMPPSCGQQEATVQLSVHGLSRGIKERPRHNYRRFALFRRKGMLAFVRSCATAAVNSICAGEQRTCKTCIRLPYCPTSCCCMTDSVTSVGG